MLDDRALDILFRAARTHKGWRTEPVEDATLRAAYELARMGPTSANCSPMRVVFVRSPEAKAKLKPCLDGGNVDKTMAAPATAIVAHDMRFYEHLPRLFPFADARSWFEGDAAKAGETAFRNGTLQGAYLIMACRALGLDCGPMSGFDNVAVDAAFFPGGRVRSNFLCNIGHGDPAALPARAPRLDFDEACSIV